MNLSPSGGTLTGSGLIGVNNGFFNPTQNLIGSYNLTYSISNPLTGCSDSKTQSIVVNDTPVLSAVSSNVSTCLGNDGSVDVSVSGGSNPISYAWNNGQTTQDLNNITAGNYSVIATDANGCQDTISTSITQPSPPTIIFSKSNVSCFGFNDGSIDVTVFGGQSPYSYSWSNGATSEDLNNLSSGFYYLTVTDSNNCVVSQGVVIDQPSEIFINSTTTEANEGHHTWTSVADQCPQTKQWIQQNFIINKQTGRIRFMYLEPGGWIMPHKDRDVHKLYEINVAITNPKGCVFRMLERGNIPFAPGKAFIIDTANKHLSLIHI